LGEENGMPEMVAVRLPSHVNAARLGRHHGLCHALDGVRGRALRAIAVCARLAVRCKDGLPEALEGSLDHTVPDRWHREDAETVPAFLWAGLLPPPHGGRRAGDQCVPSRLQNRVEPAGLKGLTRHASAPWGAVVGLGPGIGVTQRCPLAALEVQAPETPGRCRL